MSDAAPPAWVRRMTKAESGLAASAKYLLIVLWGFGPYTRSGPLDPDGEQQPSDPVVVYPSRETLARESGQPLGTVKHQLSLLVAAGWIQRGKNGSRTVLAWRKPGHFAYGWPMDGPARLRAMVDQRFAAAAESRAAEWPKNQTQTFQVTSNSTSKDLADDARTRDREPNISESSARTSGQDRDPAKGAAALTHARPEFGPIPAWTDIDHMVFANYDPCGPGHAGGDSVARTLNPSGPGSGARSESHERNTERAAENSSQHRADDDSASPVIRGPRPDTRELPDHQSGGREGRGAQQAGGAAGAHRGRGRHDHPGDGRGAVALELVRDRPKRDFELPPAVLDLVVEADWAYEAENPYWRQALLEVMRDKSLEAEDVATILRRYDQTQRSARPDRSRIWFVRGKAGRKAREFIDRALGRQQAQSGVAFAMDGGLGS